MNHTINILIAEDHKLVAEGLKDFLEIHEGYTVLDIAQNGREAISLLRQHQADLLLTDLNMPDIDGLQLLELVKKRFPKIKTLGLSMYNNQAIVSRALELGIDGYLLKEEGGEELLKAVSLIMEGEKYFSNGLKLPSKNIKLFVDDFLLKYNLTQREVEILKLIALSNTNKSIGELLSISELTVQTHRRNLKKKLKAENTADLVRFAYVNHIV